MVSKKDKKNAKLNIGGMAVIEGVMIKSENYYACAVQKQDKTISVKTEKIKTFFSKNKIFKKPFLRGIGQLLDMLILGIKTLSYSANESVGEKTDEKLSYWEIFFTIAFAFGFAILLFILLPLWLSGFIVKSNGILFNLIDGLLRLGIFLIYLLIISQLSDVKRVFQYHGAEHKAVHCYEHGLPLTVKNIKKFSTLHARCGTSFVMIVLLISVIVFSLITTEIFLLKMLLRILLMPIIAGLSYELLRFEAKHDKNKILKPLIYPGLLFQKITTKEPDDKQIEVAIKSVNAVLKAELKN